MSEEFSISSISAGVLVHAVWATLIIGITVARKWIDRIHPAARKLVLALVIVATLAGNVALYYFTGRLFLFFSSALIFFAFVALWLQLKQFWDVGLIGADRTIRGGLDYVRSLKACQNSLSFLGVGARKLTEHATEFENAMGRCNRPNRPIRFLLARPHSDFLKTAAQNAGRPADEYVIRVQSSLRAIADYRLRRKWNIEVRFYNMELPLFRLMLIDDWLCLASHYVFGEGDGSEWPQLHVRRSATERDVNSLYHPFEQYFDELWGKSEVWDFAQYIEEI
jgi:hypothetical protein